MNLRIRSLIIIFVLALPLAAHADRGAQGFFSDDSAPLTKAHKEYLSGDYKAMVLCLKEALIENPNDPVVEANVMSLMNKAYEALNGEPLPTDWRLPDEIKHMKIGVQRQLKDEVFYKLSVYGQTVHKDSIAQIQVVRYPDQIVLDKIAGIGGWDTDEGVDKSIHDYNLQTVRLRQPIPCGLYLLNITLVDGTQTKGWFILNDEENSTASPIVSMPAIDAEFATGNPTFKWTNFTSPQYKPFEVRSFWLGISRMEPPAYRWDEVWAHYERPPTSEQITIDSHGDGVSLPVLNKGSYLFFLNYHERRMFGDLTLSRDSIVMRNFKITK